MRGLGRSNPLGASDFPNILIVDDNDDNRYTLELLLQADGHVRITCASGGNDAVALLAKERFSLILLDMMMPDLSGDEVLKRIKGDPETRDTPVVVISAETDTDLISKCIEIGADDYLPKPFNQAILRARVASALRKYSSRMLENEYLAKLEQEKMYSDSLLKNIFPREIAVRIRNGESNIADYVEDASILFADVVGFARITQRMRAYEIVGCLNRLFSEFDRLAEDVKVEKIRSVGDNYMAAVGLTAPLADHARVAANLGLDMVAAAQRMESTLPAPFSIRVGVHSGPVMAGVIGIRKFAYDVWGDTVTVAARVEAAGQPNRVLVSAATAKKLEGAFKLDGPHRAETKEQRVLETFFVSRNGR
jgi:class 3 adenylate cyclase